MALTGFKPFTGFVFDWVFLSVILVIGVGALIHSDGLVCRHCLKELGVERYAPEREKVAGDAPATAWL